MYRLMATWGSAKIELPELHCSLWFWLHWSGKCLPIWVLPTPNWHFTPLFQLYSTQNVRSRTNIVLPRVRTPRLGESVLDNWWEARDRFLSLVVYRLCVVISGRDLSVFGGFRFPIAIPEVTVILHLFIRKPCVRQCKSLAVRLKSGEWYESFSK